MAKIIRDFFWEGSRDDGGMHDVNGETTASEIDGEGLDIGNFQHRNSALLEKGYGVSP